MRILLLSVMFLSVCHCEIFSQFFSATKVYEKCADAVVYISRTDGGIGAGFFINEDGYVVTNFHVVSDWWGIPIDPNSLTVRTRSGAIYNVVSLEPVKNYVDLDIAILKCDAQNVIYLPLKPTAAQIGEEVVAIGHPYGDEWNQSKGIISKIDLDNDYMLQHDVAIDRGNSGGPLINSKGQVVGVVTGQKGIINSNGNLQLFATGKVAVKASWVKAVLDNKKIKYYQNAIVMEGVTEYERQFEILQQNREELKLEQKALQNEKDALENARKELEIEKQKLAQEEIELEKRKAESWSIIERAESIRKEIENGKDMNNRKWEELLERERNIEQKENWIREKEIEINEKLTNRFAFELAINPGYMYRKADESSYINCSGSAGLFFRFGFDRDGYGVVEKSDRIGLLYRVHDNYNPITKNFGGELMKDLSLAVEFSDVFRIGVGKRLRESSSEFDYNLAFVNINATGYPLPFGLSLAVYSDDDYEIQNYVVGLYFGISFTFLRL